MGIDVGPIEVTDGLIFHIDAGNTRSYSGSGITLNSLAGLGATLVNGVGFSSANNGSFFFDGTNDYIISPSSSIYAFGYNDFTISAWFKSSDKSRYSCIFNIWSDANSGIIFYSNITNGYFRTWVHNSLMVGNIDITNGLWNNVVLRRLSSICTQYVNGVEDISTNATDNILINNLK